MPRILQIDCPVCGNTHPYKVQLSITYVTLGENDLQNNNKFTRLFTCPEENVEFQADITIEDLPPGEQIDSIEVIT